MFCAKCGANLPDNAEKCDQCGALVRIRPDRPGRKKKSGKTRLSRSEEPVLPQEKDAEKALKEEELLKEEKLFKEEKLLDPVFFEEAGKDVDVDAIIKIAHGEEPEKGDPELNMDAYLESLPLIEKIRRKIKAYHHKREEAIDEKRMQKHLERASKHFSEVETEDQKAKERRLQEELNRRREEKRRAEKAEAERLEKAKAERAEKAKAEHAAQAEAERLEKAKAERLEAVRLQEEAIRRQEEEKRAERIAAARQKERARAGAARRQEDQEQAQITASHENEGLEVIRLHGRDRTEEASVREEEGAVESALVQEAERAAEAARLLEEEEARKRAAQHEQSARQQEERERIQKILNAGSEEYDSFKPISEHNQKELSQADRQLEKLRRQRKYRNNQPDRFDEFLGRYGLTKETAVRIATLFLIVVLSVIYVMGRGSSKTTPDVPGAGEGMSGIGAVEEQVDEGTETEPSEDIEDTQVPTGGGDFENN